VQRVIFLLLLLGSLLWSLTLQDLKNMPRSVERDFYIWQFLLQESTTQNQALEAAKLVFKVNSKLNSALYKKTKRHFKKPSNYHKISSTTKKYYIELMSKMQKSGDFFNAWLALDDKKKITLFNLAGTANRATLNRPISKELYNRLTKYSGINEFLYRVEREHLNNLNQVAHSSTPIRGNKINYNNLLKIGFDNLKRGNELLASKFFKAAIYKAKDRFYKDKAIFWTFMTTKDSRYLHYLVSSYDYNIYKLIALDFLHKPYPQPAQSRIKQVNTNMNISNPISWARLKRRIFAKKENLYKLAQDYNGLNSAAYYYYILAVASNHKKEYFPILYKEYLASLPIDRQALILAIARQESQFIPASISRSFALGLMQFMPFLVKHIAKQRGEDISYEDMFKPQVALRFANTHLNYLNRYLFHPLFVAYAYNAGIGYTRRMLRKNIFKSGKYEPYLSLEMVDNEQANHYGKKVLANYVIYRMLLGSPIKITTLLKELDKPILTDKFR